MGTKNNHNMVCSLGGIALEFYTICMCISVETQKEISQLDSLMHLKKKQIKLNISWYSDIRT